MRRDRIDIPRVCRSQIPSLGIDCVGPFVRTDFCGNYLSRRRVDIFIDEDNVKSGGISPVTFVRRKIDCRRRAI